MFLCATAVLSLIMTYLWIGGFEPVLLQVKVTDLPLTTSPGGFTDKRTFLGPSVGERCTLYLLYITHYHYHVLFTCFLGRQSDVLVMIVTQSFLCNCCAEFPQRDQ